jgi:hypothetical protein
VSLPRANPSSSVTQNQKDVKMDKCTRVTVSDNVKVMKRRQKAALKKLKAKKEEAGGGGDKKWRQRGKKVAPAVAGSRCPFCESPFRRKTFQMKNFPH